MTNNTDNSRSDAGFDKSIDDMQTHNISEDGIYEIREFIDDDGNLIGNEVVDLAKEMQEIRSSLETNNLTALNNEKLAALKTDIEQLQSHICSTSELPDDVGEDEAGARFPTHNVLSNDLSFLDELELQEAEEEAAERIKKRERDLQAKSLPSASKGGWGKGFLSSSNKSKVKHNKTVSFGTQSSLESPSMKPTTTVTNITPSDFFVHPSTEMKHSIGKLEETYNMTVNDTCNPKIESNMSTRPVAFTGKVIERF